MNIHLHVCIRAYIFIYWISMFILHKYTYICIHIRKYVYIGTSPLVYTAEKGNLELLKFLIENNADVNIQVDTHYDFILYPSYIYIYICMCI
jgi:hypothetical protein